MTTEIEADAPRPIESPADADASTSAPADADAPTGGSMSANSRVRVGAVIVSAGLIALLVWLVVRDSSSESDGQSVPATLVTSEALSAAAEGETIYWLGPREGTNVELTILDTGRAFVRYLPVGVPAGAQTTHLTVGSYPVDDAFAVTTSASKQPSSVPVPVTGGAVAFYGKSAPSSVYVAYPDSDVQIEVFDPSPARARALVRSGRLTPVE